MQPPNEKQIPAAAFTETKRLAENARNVVSLGHINDKVVVLKRVRAATANPDRCPASRRFDAERRYAWALSEDSDFVLRPIYTIVEAPVMAMVMPYCVHGSLDLLCRRPLSYVFSLLLMTDAAKGVAHAHALGVVLRDVKPGNCLVGADGVARLADFELVRHQCRNHDIDGMEADDHSPVDVRTGRHAGRVAETGAALRRRARREAAKNF
mmetsp:Transcript_7038/g.17325  ORF Transcript_7038/g.17325 Transcript_7038/m.17325 type:complete len:210 (-) Transcript_7038:1469-2098(-)